MGEKLEAKKRSELSQHQLKFITELELPLRDILLQLKPSIEKGGYKIIVGEDVSGRIPALIVWNVVKQIYEKNGFSSPPTRFITGGERAAERDVKLRTHVRQIRKDVEKIRSVGQRDQGGNRALVVTETIMTGSNIEGIVRALIRGGFKIDVATVGSRDPGRVLFLERKLHANVYAGMRGTPDIYPKGRSLSGVRKDRGDIFSYPIRDAVGWEYNQKKVNAARQLVKETADRLVVELESGEEAV